MYQALLTRRYLFSKIMPLLAAIAVAMCTAMVLVTWSVMGGFLNQLLASGRSLMGDVSIDWTSGGIPYYADLLERLREDDAVDAATPTIETLGIISLPDGRNKAIELVGVDPVDFDRVTGFYGTLYWKPLTEPTSRDKNREDIRLGADMAEEFKIAEAGGRTFTEPNSATGAPEPAAVLGAMVAGTNSITEAHLLDPTYGRTWTESVTISLMELSERGNPKALTGRRFPVANEFRSGMYILDDKRVFLPIDVVQKMRRMEEAPKVDPNWKPGRVIVGPDGKPMAEPPRTEGTVPAKVTHILIRAKDGFTPEQVEARAEVIFEAFAHDQGLRLPPSWRRNIYTWDKKPGLASFVTQVKKETVLVLGLFGFISMTAIFLVLAIFWAMVAEKTKDIGVLRAIGASRGGVAWLWLRYGLAIGVVGAITGGILAYLVVLNINPIHEWLGRAMGVVIWDPAVYYFSEIPNKVESDKAVLVLVVGILSSVIGALIPAIRAAWMDPVKALRFE